MRCGMAGLGAFSLATLILLSSGASGQLALSANDGKAVLIDGVNSVPANPTPDTVTVIDLGATPPKVLAELQAPASVVGPPLSVALARNESFALVTGASKVDPSDPKKTVPDDKLTVIDLKASLGAAAGRQGCGGRINQSRRNAGAGRQPVGRDGLGLFHCWQFAHAGRQGQSGRCQIGSEPCRHHTGWQDRAGHPRRRQQDFRAFNRRYQGRGHQARDLGGNSPLRSRHPSERKGRGRRQYRSRQWRCRYRKPYRY